MCHIKEPDGVDLVINSRQLTEKEESAISDFIKAYYAKHSRKTTAKKMTSKRKIVAELNNHDHLTAASHKRGFSGSKDKKAMLRPLRQRSVTVAQHSSF